MNLSAQEYLAKLLAKENLSVQHGNYSTASFDVVNRVLRLPLWKDKGKEVDDLLVGHGVLFILLLMDGTILKRKLVKFQELT